jgi:sulfur relay (sulfurtransferase) DsrC/TusE family protein
VGQLADQLRNTQVPLRPQKPWTPSVDYAFIASHLPPGEREAYIQRSREWFETNAPVLTSTENVECCTIDNTPIITAIAKHARETGRHGRPPVKEMVKAMRAGGYPEERVDKYRQWCQHMEDTAEERQEVLDRIFAKYPSASKPDPKPKVKKVIKAVKKRMGNEQAD